MLEQSKKFDKTTWLNFGNQGGGNPTYEIPEVWDKIFYKRYPRFEQTKLTSSYINGEIEKLVLARESKIEFSQEPISFNDLSYLLQYSAGQKPSNPDRRVHPSGGARYPIEIYIFGYNLEKLSPGTYHYNVKHHTLEKLRHGKPPYEELFGNNGSPSIVLLMTGVLARAEVKYLNMAYKFALIECGHIAQNINLLSQKRNLNSCCIGGFDNKKIIDYLDLIQEEEIPLYTINLGLPSKEVNKIRTTL